MNYSIADIVRYFSGEMSEDEMYALEKASLENPFLAHALEGYEKMKVEDLKKLDINSNSWPDPEALEKGNLTVPQENEIKRRCIEENFEIKKELPTDRQEEKRSTQSNVGFIRSKLFRFAIGAAAIAILVIGGYYFLSKKNIQGSTKLAEDQLLAEIAQKLQKNFYETQGRGSEHDNLNALLENGKYDDYIRQSKEELIKHPNHDYSVRVNANIARCYILLGKPDSALAFISKMPDDDANSCDIKFVKSIALITVKKIEDGNDILLSFKDSICPSYRNDAIEILNLLKNKSGH